MKIRSAFQDEAGFRIFDLIFQETTKRQEQLLNLIAMQYQLASIQRPQIRFLKNISKIHPTLTQKYQYYPGHIPSQKRPIDWSSILSDVYLLNEWPGLSHPQTFWKPSFHSQQTCKFDRSVHIAILCMLLCSSHNIFRAL